MATTIEYNGVTLHNVLMREFDQEVMYDESGTDPIGNRIKMRVQGILHGQNAMAGAPAFIAMRPGQVDAASALEIIRPRLLAPRQRLRMVMDGRQMFNVGVTQFDIDNGPKPRGLSITHVAGKAVFRVVWSVEFAIAECPDESPSFQPVTLNNRWSTAEAMDANFFTTRRIEGVIRISNSRIPVHKVKGLVVPGLEDGFKRESIEYASTPDGLHARYVVVDRQVKTAAPFPATSISGTHSESTSDGVTFLSECSVRLEGSPDADPAILLQRAVQIIDARLKILGVPPDKSDFILENAQIRQFLGEANTVEASVTVRRNPEVKEWLANLHKDIIGKPLELPPLQVQGQDQDDTEYLPTKNRKPAIYGYDVDGAERDPAVLLLLNCYLQTPCKEEHGIAQFEEETEDKEEDTGESDNRYDTYISGGTVAEIPTSDVDQYSDDHQQAVYTVSTLNNVYEIHKLRAQMPIARRMEDVEAEEEGEEEEPPEEGEGDQDEEGEGEETSRDTCKIFELGLGVARRIITFEMERVGAWPQLPAPLDEYTDGDLIGTLMHQKVGMQPPTLSADGRKPVFVARGRYVYALNRPPTIRERLRVGVLPFTKFEMDDTAFIGQDAFDEGVGP